MSIPAEDQDFLAQFDDHSSNNPLDGLLSFAKANNYRVTSTNGGSHNAGSAHYQGRAIDIDHRGVNYDALLRAAAANGYTVRDERSRPVGQKVWGGPHFHIQAAGAAHASIHPDDAAFLAQFGNAPQPTAADVQPIAPLPQVQIQPGQHFIPIPAQITQGTAPSQFAQQSSQFNQQLLNQASQLPGRLALPAPVPTQEQMQQQANAFVNSGAPQGAPAQPQNPNLIQGLGNIANDVGHGLGNSWNTIVNTVTHPDQLFQQAGATVADEAQHTRSPLDTVGGVAGGAGLGVADLLNGLSSLPADIANSYLGRKQFAPTVQIPTGDLQNYLKDKGASSFVGQLLPFVAAEVLSGGEATPGLLTRMAKHIGTGAGFGALNDAHGAGLAGRAEGAGNLAALGGVLGGAGEALEPIARRLFPEKIKPGMPDKDIIAALTPDELKLIEKAQYKPIDDGLNPAELTQAFEQRSADVAPSIIKPSEKQLILPEKMQGGQLHIERSLPEGRDLSSIPSNPDILQNVKSARDSADVFKTQANDIKTAESLASDATQERVAAQQELLKTTGETDPVEAQRQLGQRINQAEALGNEITPEVFAQLETDRALLRRVLDSRQQELEAIKLLEQEQKLTSRSELPQPEQAGQLLPEPNTKLRSSADIAMRRAEQIGQGSDILKKTEPNRNLLDFTKGPDRSADLIKDINREPAKDNLIQFPGKDEHGPVQILGANGKPIEKPSSLASGESASSVSPGVGDSTIQTQSGGEVFHQGMDSETVNNAAQLLADAVRDKGGQLMTIAEAERFIKQNGYPGIDHFLNALEAGKNNQTLMVEHRPLDKGGQVTNTREVHPFAFEKRTIKGATEVGHLLKEHSPKGDGVGANLGAVRDNLVQRLSKAGESVNAAEQAIEDKTPRTARTILNKLANRLPESERTHVYLHDHNFGESSRPSTSGARRLDRIDHSSLTGKANEAAAKYDNKIAPAFEKLDKIMAMPDAPPEMKRIIKQMASGKLSKQSARDLRKVYESLPKDVLNKLCRL